MKITNPTSNDITIQYKGVSYTAPANGSVYGVSTQAAEYWKTMLHQFIIVEDESTVVTDQEEIAETKVVAEPIVEVVAPVAEVVVDTPVDVPTDVPSTGSVTKSKK